MRGASQLPNPAMTFHKSAASVGGYRRGSAKRAMLRVRQSSVAAATSVMPLDVFGGEAAPTAATVGLAELPGRAMADTLRAQPGSSDSRATLSSWS